MMKRKIIEILESEKKYIEDWLERNAKAQEVVHYVNRDLHMVSWQLSALKNSPDEEEKVSLADVENSIERGKRYIEGCLPQIPEYDTNTIMGSVAVTATGSAAVYSYVAQVGDLKIPGVNDYSEKHTYSYRELQQAQNRLNEVRKLIEGINNQQTIDRFDRAASDYAAFQSGSGNRCAAALGMRTLLDGVKGDLFQLASNTPRENMNWSKMASRLSKGGQSSFEELELLNHESNRSSLISVLSVVAKDREGTSPFDLDNIWTLLLDHLYAVLGWLDYSKSLKILKRC